MSKVEYSVLMSVCAKDIPSYMDWSHRNDSYPAVLDESDFNRIKESGAYFARKIDLRISSELIKIIEDSIR